MCIARWLLVLAFAASADAGEAGRPGDLAGLLTPPIVPDGPPGCVRIDVSQKLALHSDPSTQAPRIGWLVFRPWRDITDECDLVLPYFEASAGTGGRRLPAMESGYEMLALAVLERQGEWLRLDLGEGPGAASGWLHPPPGHQYEPYPDLLAGKLAYATPAWQGQLCASPGTDCRRLQTTPEQSLTVHSTYRRDGVAWLEVELTSDPCRGDGPAVLERGWIRATEGREATAWFHSRGC